MPMRSATETLKRISGRLYWDLKENLPLAYRRGDLDSQVRLTPPGDAYPVVGHFYKHVYNVIREYFESAGSSFEKVVPRRKILLANKVQYPDFAVEIILDSQVIGHVLFDIEKRCWRFRPLYHTVLRMVEQEEGFYARVSHDKITRGYVVKPGQLASARLPERDEYIALASRNLDYLGVGALLRNGRIYVLKSWRRVPITGLEGDPDWSKVVEAHYEYLERKEEEAISFLREIYAKYRLPVVVSFSGGKDSLVTLHLALKALGHENVKALFNDTGIEFPETVDYVKRTVEKMGVELVVANAGEAFWRGFSVMGPPARDFRWCCKVTKFAPTARLLKQLFPSGALSLVGQRKYESAQRAVSPRIWRNAWLPNVLAATPIQDWTAFDVWLYIFREKLLPNPLYYYGLDRLGCWLCPASEIGEFELARKVRNELYIKWEEELKKFAVKNNLGDEWIKLGLWRWVQPPNDILRLATNPSFTSSRGASVTWTTSDNTITFQLENTKQFPNIEKFRNILYTNKGAWEALKDVSISENKIVIELETKAEEYIEEFARVTIRSFYCAECLECANWCTSKAVQLDVKNGGIHIRQEQCVQCNTCNLKCPIAEYTLKLRLTH